MADKRPLCVDLDGTLVRSDTTMEATLALLRRRPGAVFSLLPWWRAGRPVYKRRVAELAAPDPKDLPYNQAVLARLRAEKAGGRELVLVTGSDIATGRTVAAELGLFDLVLGSDGETNLSGGPKAAELVRRFGEGGFDYLGNSAKDLPVWAKARIALAVDLPPDLLRRARAAGLRLEVIPEGRPPRWRALLAAPGAAAWAGGLPALAPLLVGGGAAGALTAALAFCLGSAGIAMLSELLDLPAARRHAARKRRPLASGRVSLALGLASGLGLSAAGLALAGLAGALVLAAFAGRAGLQWWYRIGPARRPWTGVPALAGMHALALAAGAAAGGASVPAWFWAAAAPVLLILAWLQRRGGAD